MAVDCLIEDQRWQAVGLDAIAEAAAAGVFARLGLEPGAWGVSLLGCNDARIAELNADFRGKPQPTNVLSWPSEERGAAAPGAMPPLPRPDPSGDEVELGDIAIAYDTCLAEAAQAGRTLHDHALHLVAHGLLHLLGFDHERDADAALMEGIEREVLGKLGIADPYQSDEQEKG
ncbi:MAG: rRNA maturation RNase YbeY [Rubellimicrobium sp.]|nr:rRNA maturation RNase YbeY [Rubellimicrobium sp.]